MVMISQIGSEKKLHSQFVFWPAFQVDLFNPLFTYMARVCICILNYCLHKFCNNAHINYSHKWAPTKAPPLPLTLRTSANAYKTI